MNTDRKTKDITEIKKLNTKTQSCKRITMTTGTKIQHNKNPKLRNINKPETVTDTLLSESRSHFTSFLWFSFCCFSLYFLLHVFFFLTVLDLVMDQFVPCCKELSKDYYYCHSVYWLSTIWLLLPPHVFVVAYLSVVRVTSKNSFPETERSYCHEGKKKNLL